jgi:hypothetical protein
MDKKSDALMRKMLKNWMNRQSPPENGRARLLWEAAHSSRSKFDLTEILLHPQFRPYSPSSPPEWSQTLFTWINENSLQLRIQARVI